MEYRVFEPAEILRPFIKCFWTLEGVDINQEKQRVVPDGCMEMIFNYGDHYRQFFTDGSDILQPRSFVFGQFTNFIEIAPTGKTGIIAARFYPDGLVPFIDIPVSSLENKAVDIKDVLGVVGASLESEVVNAVSNEQRLELISNFLISKLSDQKAIDTITKECVEIIFNSQGQLPVDEVSDRMNINRRMMERKFAEKVGMSPKQLSKVIRLQSSLKMLRENNFSSLTSIAYENGYYDQAHFIRDFKEFTGISPKLFFSSHLKLATIFAGEE